VDAVEYFWELVLYEESGRVLPVAECAARRYELG
jgi:hypothetical protein